MCGECRRLVLEKHPEGSEAYNRALQTADARCRHSMLDEESQPVKLQRMLDMIAQFYKSDKLEAMTVEQYAMSANNCSRIFIAATVQATFHLSTHVRPATGATGLLQDR
jgi:hypothetical protein